MQLLLLAAGALTASNVIELAVMSIAAGVMRGAIAAIERLALAPDVITGILGGVWLAVGMPSVG
jgi:hypothetical protein